MISNDLNEAITLVYDRTGLVPEVETATELAEVLLEWGEAIASDNLVCKRKGFQMKKQEDEFVTLDKLDGIEIVLNDGRILNSTDRPLRVLDNKLLYVKALRIPTHLVISADQV